MIGARTKTALAAAALVVMVAVAYFPALDAGYIWDDPAHITENKLLRDAHGLVRIWTEVGAHQQFYPLTLSVFWIEYQLWGLNPLGYHLINVLLQACAALLVWRVCRRLALPGAWAAAAIFGLHPVHVESVAWATELKNVLSGVFYLASMLFMLDVYDLYPANASPTPRATVGKKYFAGLTLFLCAILSKTVASTLPAALLVLVWWRRGRLRWADALPLLPFFAVGVGLGLVTVSCEIDIGATGEAFKFTFVERLLIAGRALWFYAGKLVWPVELIFNYPRWEIDGRVAWQYLYPAGALAVFATLWRVRDRIGRGPLAAALFFSGSLFPALGFFNVYPMQFSFVADHFQYLASLGPIVAGTVGLAVWLQRRPVAGFVVGSVVGSVGLAVLLGLYGLKTWELTHYYKDSETLYSWIISKNSDSFLAHYNLGTELMLEQRTQEAIPHLAETLRIKPRHLRGHINLGTALASLGAYDDAIPFFEKAIEINPSDATIYYNLGLAQTQRGDLDGASRAFARAVELNPKDAQTRFYLGYIAGQQGRFEVAVDLLQLALTLRPDFLEAAELLQRARFELQRRTAPQ